MFDRRLVLHTPLLRCVCKALFSRTWNLHCEMECSRSTQWISWAIYDKAEFSVWIRPRGFPFRASIYVCVCSPMKALVLEVSLSNNCSGWIILHAHRSSTKWAQNQVWCRRSTKNFRCMSRFYLVPHVMLRKAYCCLQQGIWKQFILIV